MSSHQNKLKRGAHFLRFSDLVFISVFTIVLLSGTQMLSIDSDLGRHLTLGNYILDERAIPTLDVLSHTLTGQSRPPYEWLSQVVFALADRILRLDGVILLTAFIIGFTFLLLYQHSKRRSRSPLISLLLVFLAALATSIHWLPRPHIVTILFLVIWINKLEQLRNEEESHLLIFPFLMFFWVNLHGGFVFGFLAWGAYLAGWLWDRWWNKAASQTRRNFILAGIYSFAASIVTPDFWRNWEAVLNNRSAYILSRTSETMPPDLTDPSIFSFTLLLFLTLLLFTIHWKSLSTSHVFLLSGLGFMALLMARNIPLFAVASVPILTELAQKSFSRFDFWSRIEERFAGFAAPSRLSFLALIPILLATFYFAVYQKKNDSSFFHFNPRVFPVQAVEWLETNPQSGNMFNEFNWGGYLTYRLWPGQKVFLDSQSDFYGESLIKEYERMTLVQEDWNMLLEKYQVDWAIIPPDWPLTAELKKIGWIPVYEDEIAVILVEK